MMILSRTTWHSSRSKSPFQVGIGFVHSISGTEVNNSPPLDVSISADTVWRCVHIQNLVSCAKTPNTNVSGLWCVVMTDYPRPTKQDSCCLNWASTLKPVGVHYYGSVLNDAESLLELHSRSTMCNFGTSTSTSKPLAKVSESSDENQPPTAKQASKVSSSLLQISFKIINHINHLHRLECFGIIQLKGKM